MVAAPTAEPPTRPDKAVAVRTKATFRELVTALNDAGHVGTASVEGARDALVGLTLRVLVVAYAETSGLAAPAKGPRARLRRFEGSLDLFSSERAWILDHLDEATLSTLLDAMCSVVQGAPLEAIGTSYEQLIGLSLVVAAGTSVALNPGDTVIDLDALLGAPPEERERIVADRTGTALSARSSRALRNATRLGNLVDAMRARLSPGTPEAVRPGTLLITTTEARRRSGSHYTPRAITAAVVERALRPLLGQQPPDVRVCDPAMGCGAFLLETCRVLAAEGLEARNVVERCVYGADRDPLAVDLARASLWLFSRQTTPPPALRTHLRAGDSLLGAWRADLDVALAGESAGAVKRALDAQLALSFWPPGEEAPAGLFVRDFLRAAGSGGDARELAIAREVANDRQFLHWELAFPEVFERGGFDAIVGNPPWVAYAGRAAQPLPRAEHEHFLRTSPAFFGYRTLHGLFIHRSATLLRPGGRLGLVVPTSVADLAGYGPARKAHDALAMVDDELPDFGADEFEGVFQPAMALLSTRRGAAVAAGDARTWRLARADLDADSARLLDRLMLLPPLPASLFGERGFQSQGDDVKQLRELHAPEPPFSVPIREGRDIGPFQAHRPRLFLDAAGVTARFRPPEEWRAVGILIRQTARYPMAALSDGAAFRNSILAGFAAPEHDVFVLLAYLNSTPVRWLHFMRFRDARQGMPQVKIGHLRAIPSPPALALAGPELARLGRTLGERNTGITDDEQGELDQLVARALELSVPQRTLLDRFRRENPPPVPTRVPD